MMISYFLSIFRKPRDIESEEFDFFRQGKVF